MFLWWINRTPVFCDIIFCIIQKQSYAIWRSLSWLLLFVLAAEYISNLYLQIVDWYQLMNLLYSSIDLCFSTKNWSNLCIIQYEWTRMLFFQFLYAFLWDSVWGIYTLLTPPDFYRSIYTLVHFLLLTSFGDKLYFI